MAQKKIGYIELYWRCPNCSNENLGSHAFCTSCGSPQPQNVEFHQASKQQLLKDESKLKQAKAGADIHCGFCGTMNAGSRLKCGNCGSSLKHGEPAKKATAPVPAATPMPRAALFIIGAVVLVLCAAVYFLFLRTTSVVAAVTGVNWQRSVVIEGFGFVELEGWRDDVPGDAAILGCRQEVRSVQSEPPSSDTYDEVCGTPYSIETGGGFAEVVQDCEYHVYDDYCSYEAQTWAPIATVELQGVDLSPEQPSPMLSNNERLGSQNASYTCYFESDGGDTYAYTTDSLNEFLQCEIGSVWQLSVNGTGAVVGIEPAN